MTIEKEWEASSDTDKYPLFKGFSPEVVASGMAMIAKALGQDSCVVSNSTTKSLREGLADSRPLLIQNHGSIEKAIEAYRTVVPVYDP
jgi:hypothetical protein